MKHVLLVTLLIVTIAVAGYWTYYRGATAHTRSMLHGAEGEMEWLRREYHLSDVQFERIKQIHQEYAPKCERLCQKIAKANARFHEVTRANKTYTPEVEAAMKECLAIQGECRQALLAHVYDVSAQMPTAEGERYLEMMRTRLIMPSVGHQAAIAGAEKGEQ